MSEAKLRTLIVDDEPLAVERLQRLCERSARLEVIGSALGGTGAIELGLARRPDLILLDIGMADIDGLEVARTLQRTGSPAIVFTTAFSNFAVDAFEISAVDYLLKPVGADRLELAAERAAIRLQSKPAVAEPERADELWVPNRGVLTRLALADVKRFTAERDYVRIHALGRSYLLHGTMSGIERRLDPAEFMRTHRSEIVRRSAVTGLTRDSGGSWSACLDDGSSARVGRSYLPLVRDEMGIRKFGD
jgi:two-component system response regulator AlgR